MLFSLLYIAVLLFIADILCYGIVRPERRRTAPQIIAPLLPKPVQANKPKLNTAPHP